MKRFLNKKGFTFIELIIVMPIIGILVLLATPRFVDYTKEARDYKDNNVRVEQRAIRRDFKTGTDINDLRGK